jgi:Icc-related predicted phosphoesterase
MLLCAAGDTHGAIDRMYDEILAFEGVLGVHFDCVLHVGDLGVWPDPTRVDKATQKHDGAGDFAKWFAERRAVPRKTVFIKGNHEDHDWLDAQLSDEILPGLFYLRNGRTIDLGEGRDIVRVGGIGGCYSPRDYPRKAKQLRGAEKAHYTHDEIAALGKGIDILLLHEAPAGVRFAAGHTSAAEGLRELMERVRPFVCLFGHHHERIDVKVPYAGLCMGLNLIGRAGNLVAFDFARRAQFEGLGER